MSNIDAFSSQPRIESLKKKACKIDNHSAVSLEKSVRICHWKMIIIDMLCMYIFCQALKKDNLFSLSFYHTYFDGIRTMGVILFSCHSSHQALMEFYVQLSQNEKRQEACCCFF